MTYPGGKNGAGVYQTIINLMPPHQTYIEPFLGGGAIMRLKRPARLNIGIDLVQSAVQAMQSFTVQTGAAAGHIAAGDAGGSKTAGRGDGSSFRFECRDGIEYLNKYRFQGRELVYCDPPYLMETRSGRRLYEFEMTAIAHRRLLRVVTSLPCLVMVSGYWSEMYAEALKGWASTSFQAMTRGGRLATEWLWFNYPVPVALHDYRYLGCGFRERERIKRKKRRWVDRLRAMPVLEKRALLAAIAETDNSGDGLDPLAGSGAGGQPR